MLATGKLPPDALPGNLAGQDCILGLEFSGRNSKGKRVMGMVPAKSLATTVLADPGFLWEVPDAWTLEEAATVPVVYGTVSLNFFKQRLELKIIKINLFLSFYRVIML